MATLNRRGVQSRAASKSSIKKQIKKKENRHS